MKKRILNIGFAAVLILLSSAPMYAQDRDHNGNNKSTNDRRDQVAQRPSRNDHVDDRVADRYDRKDEYRDDHREYRRDDNRDYRRDDRGDYRREERRENRYHYWVPAHWEMRGCYRVWVNGYWA